MNASTVDPELSGGIEIVTAHLPSIDWEKPPVAQVASPPTVEVMAEPSISADQKAAPFQEAKPVPDPQAAVPKAKPPEQVAAAIPPAFPATATDPVVRPVELRPMKDVSISSTLRAVVLGGNARGSAADPSAPAAQILAPRATAPPAAPASINVAPADAVPPVVVRESPVADFAGLQGLFMARVPLDLHGVAALTAALPGVHACLIRGAVGSAEAGEMPPGLNVEELRAASEEFARKAGGVEGTTIHRGDSTIAVFSRGGVCLSAVIDSGGFVPGVRERLSRVTQLLSGAPSPR